MRCFTLVSLFLTAWMSWAGPAAAEWQAAASLADPRSDHSATLLPSGEILVAGGIDGNGDGLASSELYEPATGLWLSGGSLVTPRSNHTATLLPSGRVLVAGGAGTGGLLANAEI